MAAFDIAGSNSLAKSLSTATNSNASFGSISHIIGDGNTARFTAEGDQSAKGDSTANPKAEATVAKDGSQAIGSSAAAPESGGNTTTTTIILASGFLLLGGMIILGRK